MKQKRVIFLGGSYAQIPIIEDARERGWYVITCDYLPDNPGHKLANEYHNISTTDREGILALTKDLAPDFVIAYASDPAALTAAYVSEQLGLPGNPYESILLLSEKDLFRKFLRKNGFNSPQAVTINLDDDYIEKIKGFNYPFIIKPTDSSGSKGVTKVESLSQINIAYQYALSFSRNKRIIVEEFIDTNSEQLHGDGFVYNGELIFYYLGNHHYNTNINPFVPYSTTWPCKISEKISLKIDAEIKKLISLSGFKNGAINIEIRILNSNKIFFMEIGPRSGGNFVPQVIKYATNFDMVKATLDFYEGRTILRPNCHLKNNAAYYVIHSGISGILKNLIIKDSIKKNIKEFHQYIRIGEKVNSFQGANAAIGILLLIFDSTQEMDYIIENMNKYIILQIEEKNT